MPCERSAKPDSKKNIITGKEEKPIYSEQGTNSGKTNLNQDEFVYFVAININFFVFFLVLTGDEGLPRKDDVAGHAARRLNHHSP